MYFCVKCMKVVKNGNVCSCGAQLTPKDEVIYCPDCGKMYFKPNKSFICRRCNTPVNVVNEQQNTNRDTTKNQEYAQLFLNNTGAENNNTLANVTNTTINNNQTATVFPHPQIKEDNVQSEIANNATKEVRKENDDEFDDSLFENATEVENKQSKKNKKGEQNEQEEQQGSQPKGKSSLGVTLSIAFSFAIIVLAVIYTFIVPLMTPSYRVAWDNYISSENQHYKAFGVDIKYTTLNFIVDEETESVVKATTKVEKKTYNSATKEYDTHISEITIQFKKVGDKFYIDQDTFVGIA